MYSNFRALTVLLWPLQIHLSTAICKGLRGFYCF